MKYRSLKVLLIGLCLAASPTSLWARKLSKENLAPLYSEQKFTTFSTVVFYESPGLARVYLNIRLNDFRYLKFPGGLHPVSRLSVHYELYDSWESREPLDSATILFSDSVNAGKKMEMIIDFPIRNLPASPTLLYISLTDLNTTGKQVFDVIEITSFDRFGNQHLLVTDQSGYPVFGKAIQNDRYFHIQCSDTLFNRIFIRYYSEEFPLARPPFVLERSRDIAFETDSLFIIELEQGISPLMQLPYLGIYHIQPDTSRNEGLTLFRFEGGFPVVETPEQALAPIRYLTTQKEFDRLLSYSDYTVAIDSFWLQRATQQPARAKNMIKKYYSRVEIANKLFTSYHEGWKTDRGLIYIIYGPPSGVYRSPSQEEWIYGEPRNPLSIRFTFTRNSNPFTGNDYRLIRSPSYKSGWYIAIENWRR